MHPILYHVSVAEVQRSISKPSAKPAAWGRDRHQSARLRARRLQQHVGNGASRSLQVALISYSLGALCAVRMESGSWQPSRQASRVRQSQNTGARACCLGHAFCPDVLTLSSSNPFSDGYACSRRQRRFVPPAPFPDFQRWPRRPLSLRRPRPEGHEPCRYHGKLLNPRNRNRNSPCTTRSRATRCGRLSQLGSVACFDVAS
jgi:hypothetical protein